MLLPGVLSLAACAPGGAIHQVGPNTYQITHTMGKYSPTKGVRQGVIDRATAKCEKQQGTYKRLREEMTPEGYLSYTLTFECTNPQAK
ncbi:MAG: hypothetical protein DI585_03500 [Pseudomonas fluorescens]|nr:MAG: hypothetical protein DI585_03500 [Pseudomonas fluorescens]